MLFHILKAKRGSVTMMSVGMLPVFLLLASTIVLAIVLWTSYARLVTAAEAGALAAAQYEKDGAVSSTVKSVTFSTNSYSIPKYDRKQQIAEKVQQIVMKNGAGPHGEIFCDHGRISVIATYRVYNRWSLRAKGMGTQEIVTCNWRKIQY